MNIAAYKVYYYEHHQLKHTTNAQVGKLYTKTPVFKGRLRYVEFNPTWTVPVSIIRTGMFEKIKKDPGYLAANNFDLLDASGNIVNPYALDYTKYTSHSFPYTVRQKPGPDNALGEVKFIFPNPHSVFLHDTPSKSLFDREERAFSHGCVRTQYPLDLAAVILEGSEWNKAKIDATIQTRVTTRAFPDEDIDVLIMYWTAGYYEGDGIGFFKDIYERDTRLLEQLNKVDHRVALVRNN